MEVQAFLRFRFTRSSRVSCLPSSIRPLSAVLCLLSFHPVPLAGAAVRLAAPFTDGAVLQRGARVPVWGTAAPGEAVRVTFAGQERTAVAGEDGRWRVDLAPMPASREGRTLAANGALARDVLVGEVWLCAGQSNMGVPFWGDSPRQRERLGGALGQVLDLPLLRCAALKNGWSDAPRADGDVRWERVTPAFCLKGGFSAVALWYGYYLQTTLKVPVGLLGAWVGATDIETWIPDCTLPPPPGRETRDGQKPSQYHNGKVAPVAPYALRGAIWYQGESNTASPEVIAGYGARMRALLDGWRRVFENPRLKLYFCQVCPWGSPLVPLMQEEQARFARSEPDAGMAVLCDVGNLHDIHPNEKQVPGLRLALLALKRDYGFGDIVADSPELRSWRVEGGRFVLSFDHVEKWSAYDPDWRTARDPARSAEYGFEVAGADGVWRPAQIGNWRPTRGESSGLAEYRGQIDGRDLVVWSDGVKEPKRLRYLHSRPWRGFLMNEAGLPLGAFHVGD